jgi:dihydroflavonol-4-reductase
VTGASGFLGAHTARLLCRRGDSVRVTCRNPERLNGLGDVGARPRSADICDFDALRRAFDGTEVVFHTAGFVGSRPADRAWRINAQGALTAVAAAAAAGCRRVVVTSSISAVGVATETGPADEETTYPLRGFGLTYPDSKHEGERLALDAGTRLGVEVVVVNPGYVLGAPVPGGATKQTSTRIVGNYLRGRLPAVMAAPMNFVDVEDVAAGHLLAAERGRPGERYILGGRNTTWSTLIDRVAALSGVHHPVVVLPRATARVSRMRADLGLPGLLTPEGYELMAQDWRFSSAKARRELDFHSRPLDETLTRTIDWYRDQIAGGGHRKAPRSPLSTAAAGAQALDRFGLLTPLRFGQRLVGRRVIAGV